MNVSGPIGNTDEVFNCGGPRSFHGREGHVLAFNSDIVNSLLKINGGKTEGLILLFLKFGAL